MQNILERTTKIGTPIGNPSTCLISVPSAKKVQPLRNLFNDILKTDFIEGFQIK